MGRKKKVEFEEKVIATKCIHCKTLVHRNAPSAGLIYEWNNKTEAICAVCGHKVVALFNIMNQRWGWSLARHSDVPEVQTSSAMDRTFWMESRQDCHLQLQKVRETESILSSSLRPWGKIDGDQGKTTCSFLSKAAKVDHSSSNDIRK